MKVTVLLSALLVAALALVLGLSIPKPLHAIMCCDNGGYQTDQHWHMAATCAEAQAAHRAASLPEAQANCGGSTAVCAFIVPNCYVADGMYVSDGPATYGCKTSCPIFP